MDIALQESLNLKLVQEVGKYPCLYKTDTPEYCRRSITDKAWSEVGQVVGWSGQKCKEKFKNIRSVACRYKKLMNAGVKKRPYYLMEHLRYAYPYFKPFNVKTSGKTEAEPQTDKYANSILYEEIDNDIEIQEEMKVEMNESPYTSPKQCYETSSTYDESLLSPTSEFTIKPDPPSRPDSKDKGSSFNQSEQRFHVRTALSTNDQNALQNDPKKMFLLSLLPDIYAMDDKQTRKFKRGALQLVDDILSDA